LSHWDHEFIELLNLFGSIFSTNEEAVIEAKSSTSLIFDFSVPPFGIDNPYSGRDNDNVVDV